MRLLLVSLALVGLSACGGASLPRTAPDGVSLVLSGDGALRLDGAALGTLGADTRRETLRVLRDAVRVRSPIDLRLQVAEGAGMETLRWLRRAVEEGDGRIVAVETVEGRTVALDWTRRSAADVRWFGAVPARAQEDLLVVLTAWKNAFRPPPPPGSGRDGTSCCNQTQVLLRSASGAKDLDAVLVAARYRNKGRPIGVRVDGDVSLGELLEVADALRDAGADAVELGTPPKFFPGGRKREDRVMSGLRWLQDQMDPLVSGTSESPFPLDDVEIGVDTLGTSLLAFLGAGYTNRGKHRFKRFISRGLRHLKQQQDPEGCFAPTGHPDRLAVHLPPALAMLMAYGLTLSPIFKRASTRAVRWALEHADEARATETRRWLELLMNATLDLLDDERVGPSYDVPREPVAARAVELQLVQLVPGRMTPFEWAYGCL